MIFDLHRHRKQGRRIHSNTLSPRPSHEARALSTILVLVNVCFLLLRLLFYIFTHPIMGLWSHTSDECLCMGVFRVPDSHPFRLFGSETQVSVLFCPLGKTPNVPNAVSGLEVLSKTSDHIFSQLYVFVGSHCIPFNLPGHFDSNWVTMIITLLWLAYSVWKTGTLLIIFKEFSKIEYCYSLEIFRKFYDSII